MSVGLWRYRWTCLTCYLKWVFRFFRIITGGKNTLYLSLVCTYHWHYTVRTVDTKYNTSTMQHWVWFGYLKCSPRTGVSVQCTATPPTGQMLTEHTVVMLVAKTTNINLQVISPIDQEALYLIFFSYYFLHYLINVFIKVCDHSFNQTYYTTFILVLSINPLFLNFLP